ncbi:MAG: hypothetical protein IT386_01970 [Deltaproteobacteria bacterium]|nr:hypothetical protein [Deltaproteobacteria bacterium]
MRAERFTGATLLEAVQRAREALGPSALVVAVRGPADRGWLRWLRSGVFEVRVRRSAEPAADELRRLGARIDALGAALERSDRLADEVAALREGVEALERRLSTEMDSPRGPRPRVVRARIGPDGVDRSPDPTARSDDAWTRSSTSS